MSSSTQQKGPVLEEVIQQMQDNNLRSLSQTHTTVVNNFNSMVQQIQIFANQINAQSAEILRLQGLCKKNNIDYAIPPESQIVSPQPSTQKLSEPPKTSTPKEEPTVKIKN